MLKFSKKELKYIVGQFKAFRGYEDWTECKKEMGILIIKIDDVNTNSILNNLMEDSLESIYAWIWCRYCLEGRLTIAEAISEMEDTKDIFTEMDISIFKKLNTQIK